jgi:hypothetical protein
LINNFTEKAHHAATKGSIDGLAARKKIGFTLLGHDLRIQDFFMVRKEVLEDGRNLVNRPPPMKPVILRKAPVLSLYLLEMIN